MTERDRRALVAALAAARTAGDEAAAARALAQLERLDRTGGASTPEAGR